MWKAGRYAAEAVVAGARPNCAAAVIEYPGHMKAVCPKCRGALQFNDAGGLFEARCMSCEWKVEGTASSAWGEMPRAERMPVMSVKAAAPVAAATLKCMRDLFIEAQGLPLSQLAAQLSSADGLLVGTLAVYRMNEVEARLKPTGVRIECVPNEDDDR